MKKKTYIFRFLILISVIFIFLSFSNDKPKKMRNYGSKKLYRLVSDNYLDYNTLSIKSGIKIEFNGKNYSLKGNFRLRKDSLIWINLNHASGLPVLRAIITPDSIKYLDKINKKYYSGEYEKTAKALKINLNFKSLQSLLTNELISVSDNRKPSRIFGDYKSYIDSNTYVLQNVRNRKIKKFHKKNKSNILLLEQIHIRPCVFKIEKFEVEEIKTKKKLTIEYYKFTKIDSTLFPKRVDFTVKSDSSLTVINMKYSRIKVNSKNKYNFRIPKKYEIMTGK